ncbi:TRPC2 protein, partial [Bucorvus abyssinicus]|nr:TRPC2 protein [Bucorvus abyssinicus]
MAPVKISHVVSFSSQDPRYPVDNLLHEDKLRPWLSCPHDRSRQLRLELQLERASPIGYVDVGMSLCPSPGWLDGGRQPQASHSPHWDAGNCGCAFLQIEVGRSSWPLDRSYLTLVPSVALMTPADAKLEQNCCGVRMFKEADFLALAVGQKWDRLRLTCSQPFNRHSQFGLAFLRVRTPLDPQHPPLEPQNPPLAPQHTQQGLEEQLRSLLQQLEPGARSLARLSRPARMVLSAARSPALRHGP